MISFFQDGKVSEWDWMLVEFLRARTLMPLVVGYLRQIHTKSFTFPLKLTENFPRGSILSSVLMKKLILYYYICLQIIYLQLMPLDVS